jgi:sugar phosphate isomerase/epimerase
MLKKLGFNGIERLEASDTAFAVENAATFRKLGMGFATARGLKIEQTFRWSAAFGCEYVWIAPGPQGRNTDIDVFCRRASKFLETCRKWNLKGALHNHLGTVIESPDELDYFMKKCPDAHLLLDIGHLHGAGGDNIEVLKKYYSRLAAIHFKDVYNTDPNGAEWFDRLRFCELGGGNSGLDYQAVAMFLKEQGYDKWVMVEHDTHLNPVETDLAVSIGELKKIFG